VQSQLLSPHAVQGKERAPLQKVAIIELIHYLGLADHDRTMLVVCNVLMSNFFNPILEHVMIMSQLISSNGSNRHGMAQKNMWL
jgi:hypothetical protein